MSTYLLYIAIASVTIASPGPGVILTLSNTLRFGVMSALAGIAAIKPQADLFLYVVVPAVYRSGSRFCQAVFAACTDVQLISDCDPLYIRWSSDNGPS